MFFTDAKIPCFKKKNIHRILGHIGIYPVLEEIPFPREIEPVTALFGNFFFKSRTLPRVLKTGYSGKTINSFHQAVCNF
jgi:hypothetical protein